MPDGVPDTLTAMAAVDVFGLLACGAVSPLELIEAATLAAARGVRGD